MPDVYSDEFAKSAEQTAVNICAPKKSDPLVIGYFIGNEPPWAGRETEVVDMILKGPETATQLKLKEYLQAGDTVERRTNFVFTAFEKQLQVVCGAIRQQDPNHMILGTRFGGDVPDPMFKAASIFDVCSINVYEYEPTKPRFGPSRADWRISFRCAGGRSGGRVGADDEPGGARQRLPLLH
jgi:hypothetical protein